MLQRLCHALLRKAERSQGQRRALLKLDAATLPELHQASSPEDAERIDLLLADLQATGWVELRLRKAQAFQTLADRQPALALLDFEALAAWCGFEPQPEAWSRQLVQALSECAALQVPQAPALLDYLARNPLPALRGRPVADCVHILNALALACQRGEAVYTRELSARCFGGHSKVLDSRDELLRLLGADGGQCQEAPVQWLVSAPAGVMTEVILVENGVSFERMVRQRQAAWAQAALVFASGFKAAARRLRRRTGSSLYWHASAAQGQPAAAQVAALEAWLYEEPGAPALAVSFFGDLDFAGMRILAQLRQVFADCRGWPPGYLALLAALHAGQSHAPEEADKAGQSDPGSTGCELADGLLLPALRSYQRCVDQELWRPE